MSLAERLGLRRRVPVQLLATARDPVTGDEAAGRALFHGELRHGGETLVLRGGGWAIEGRSEAFATHVHGFLWLRDLATVTDPERGGAFIGPIVDGWLAAHEEPDRAAWRPDRIGARLAMWALHAPYVLGRHDEAARRTILGHYVRAARHAERHMERTPAGLPRIAASAGLIVAGLMLEGGDRRAGKAERLLNGALAGFVAPHGLPLSRRPADLIAVMEWLHVLRAVYTVRGREWPAAQQHHDGLVRAGLRAARLGDGGLTAVHGGNRLSAARIEEMCGWPGVAARGIGAGAESGLQRMEAGKTVLLIDAGPPPDAEFNAGAHAGALGFELSDGAERLIVNVGGWGGLDAGVDERLGTLVRTTAAHSTLVLDDTNQSEVETGAPLGAGVDAVELSRQESEAGQWLDAAHDGYRRRFGLTHRRRLYLAPGGGDLRGEDVLEPAPRGRGLTARLPGGRRGAMPFAVRFHLMPGADVTPTADGRGAVIRTPGAALWQVKVSGGDLSVDESLWIGEEGRAQRTRQLVVSGEAGADGATVKWRFEKKV